MGDVLRQLHLEGWDYALIIAVSAMATVMAYVYHPRWKAAILSLPIPFSLAVMSLGRPVDATNVLGLVALMVFTQGVRLLHRGARLPIFLAILLSVAAFCAIAVPLNSIVPKTDLAFWLCWVGVMLLACLLLLLQPPRLEPGNREELPVWLKLPLVLAITTALVLAKKNLGGFMTAFPMVGLFAAYEARHSLWTISRQISVFSPPFLVMLAVIHFAQSHLPRPAAILCGWTVFIAILLPVMLAQWKREVALAREGERASFSLESPE